MKASLNIKISKNLNLAKCAHFFVFNMWAVLCKHDFEFLFTKSNFFNKNFNMNGQLSTIRSARRDESNDGFFSLYYEPA